MGFIRSVLAPGETLIVHTHPHWRALVRPALVTVVGAGLAGIAGGFIEVQVVHAGDRTATWAMVAVLYALVFLRFGLWPLTRWARTDLVVTDERVLYRPAGSSRRCVDVPLRRISAVRFRHTLTDRALGTGCLILELGHLPPVEIDHVPEVARVHAAVYDELMRLPPPPPPAPVAAAPRFRWGLPGRR
ncbi:MULTISPECIES: PH domain-containing protein [Dietzia]|uniref:PH domain-containing protein n=1 Tax=Dietzia TaxID=37914 RepID=UPI00104DC531|nr:MULTISPECIES: PH domain-containing protein [Dietzia]MEB8326236.1 PH domain-containing protein [Dietzia kunjamensis]